MIYNLSAFDVMLPGSLLVYVFISSKVSSVGQLTSCTVCCYLKLPDPRDPEGTAWQSFNWQRERIKHSFFWAMRHGAPTDVAKVAPGSCERYFLVTARNRTAKIGTLSPRVYSGHFEHVWVLTRMRGRKKVLIQKAG